MSDVDITQVPLDQYRMLSQGDPVVVVGTVSRDNRRVFASAVMREESIGRSVALTLPARILRFMAQVVSAFSDVIRTTDGTSYTVTACGRERSDGTWEGWLEFAPDDASPVLRTRRETSQPNLTDLRYWATGLTPVYLEGALARALEARRALDQLAVPETLGVRLSRTECNH